jgi:hypothetical protein
VYEREMGRNADLVGFGRVEVDDSALEAVDVTTSVVATPPCGGTADGEDCGSLL